MTENKKVSSLPSVTTPLSGAEQLYMIQGGASKKGDISLISTKSDLNSVRSARTPATGIVLDGVSTGATTGSFFMDIGGNQDISTSPFTVILNWQYIDTSQSYNLLCGTYTSNQNGYGNYSLRVAFRETWGNFRFIFGPDGVNRTKASTTADYLEAVSGPGTLIISRTLDDVYMWLNGRQLVLTELAPSGAPAWSDAMDTRYWRVGGYNNAIPAKGVFGAPVIINRAWTQSEVNYYTLTGQLPAIDTYAVITGNQIIGASDNSDFTEGIGAWYSSSDASVTWNEEDGTMDLVASSASVGAGTAELGRLPAGNYIDLVPGARYELVVDVFEANSAGLNPQLRNSAWGTNLTSFPGTVGLHRVEFTAPVVLGANLRLGIAASTGSSSTLRLKSFAIYPVGGTIASVDLGWTAQAKGRANNINGLFTLGANPLPIYDDNIQVIEWEQSATGYILGNVGPHVFRDHVIEKLEAMPLTSTVPNVTLRRNATSGGTPVVNAVSAGTQDQWTSLTLNAAQRVGAARAYYHVTLSSAAAVRFRLTLSKR